MNGKVRAGLACAIIALAALGAPRSWAQAATRSGAPTADPAADARIRAHLEFLADDLLEGRAAGSRGFDLAARYVAAQFALLGLEPAGIGGSWFQPIELIEGSAVVPAGRLALERGQVIELESAKDFLPSPSYFAAKSSVTAPLVYAGYGVRAPARGHDDFAGLDLRGKLAVVLAGAPPTFPSTERAHYSSGFTKLPELVSRGAVGVVTVRPPWDEARVPWERLVQQSWYPGMRWLDGDGRPAHAYPQIEFTVTLGPTGAQALFEGAPKTLEEVFADAEAGRPGGFDLPGRATIGGQTLTSRKRSANVVARLAGRDPVLRNEYVVVTAHLDGIGRGAAIGGDAIYNGALDNASGIAVMLEVARALAEAPQRPRRSILFLAVTAEERGLLGADFFAEHPTVPRNAIVANVNMDTVLAARPMADFVAFGAEHSTLGPVAERAARAEGYALTPDPEPDEVIFVRSDQYPFVRRGIPALYLSVGLHARDPAVDVLASKAEWRRDRYHRPSDDAGQPIDYGTLAGLGRVNARIVTEIAEAPVRPDWNAGDFFGETYGARTP